MTARPATAGEAPASELAARAAAAREAVGKEPTWDLVLKRNSIERHKKEKFPLDIVNEIPAMAARGYEAVPEEDIVFLS